MPFGRRPLSHNDLGFKIANLGYVRRGFAKRAWNWPEAVDTRIFQPIDRIRLEGDLVWMGTWSNQEQTPELQEFFLNPVIESGIRARAYGARFPDTARRALAAAGVEYGGWLPHFRAPEVFASFCVSLHIPRHPHVRGLPGIPAIHLFEALACGIPVISTQWEDQDKLFESGDFLIARNGKEMKEHLWEVLNDADLARSLVASGQRRIRERHTCGHRVNQLLDICEEQLALTETRVAETAHTAQIP